MVLQADDGVLDGDGPHLLVKVTAAGADGVDHAAPQPVDDGGDLLDAGAGGPHDADVAGLHHVGEGHRDAGDDAGAAVGAHEQQPLVVGLLLEADLILQGDVVGEGKDVEPHVQGPLDLRGGVLPGGGKEGQVGVGEHLGGFLPAGGLLEVVFLLFHRKVVEEGGGLLQHQFHDLPVLRLHHDDHIAGVGGLGLRGEQAGVAEDILVGVGAHHDRALDDTLQGVDAVGEQHQIDGILVGVLFYDRKQHLRKPPNFYLWRPKHSPKSSLLPFGYASIIACPARGRHLANGINFSAKFIPGCRVSQQNPLPFVQKT